MKINQLKVGMVLQNPNTDRFAQIKEITFYNSLFDEKEREVCAIVCSNWCKYYQDSKTNVERQILTPSKIANCTVLEFLE